MIFSLEYLVSRLVCATDSIDNVSNGSAVTDPGGNSQHSVSLLTSLIVCCSVVFCLMWLSVHYKPCLPLLRGVCVSSGFMGTAPLGGHRCNVNTTFPITTVINIRIRQLYLHLSDSREREKTQKED